jgi:gliding motility-associatede transport system auxiliary component
MTKRSTLGGGALIALALLFIGLTILFANVLRGWRVDLTQNGLYTTAPGTVKILRELKEPINLYFFYSEKQVNNLPELKTYGVRVRELLQELAARSNGNLRLSIIDPQPFSDDEDRATELGVRGAPVGQEGQSLYFGLAGTNSTDGHQAIEFFDPRKEEFLEYDVMKLVYQLSTPKKPVVGWMSSIPMGGAASMDPRTGEQRDPPVMYTQAEELFNVKPVALTATSIDPDVDVLVIVHPKGLSPATQFAIDQYALRGGRILMFVDPVAEADMAGADPSNPMAAMTANKSSDPGPLLKTWGVDFNPQEVIGDLGHALQVAMRQGDQPVRHLGILGLDQSTFNPKDVVDSGLNSVNVASIGHLSAGQGVQVATAAKPCDPKVATPCFEALITSSDQAAPIPAQRFAVLFDPSQLREGFKPTGQRYTLAARISGNVKTAFPNGAPAGAPAGGTVLKESAKPLNLIVIADTDLLQDFMWVRVQNFFGQRVPSAIANNGDLVANALDNLGGSSDLISVRGRATFNRPFDRVEALRRNAEDRFRAKEQQLEEELKSTEQKLSQMQSSKEDQGSMILSPEQEQELERFKQEQVRIRKSLRDVRLQLNEEIQNLRRNLMILNIVVLPLFFVALIAGYGYWRRKRRSRFMVPGVTEARA